MSVGPSQYYVNGVLNTLRGIPLVIPSICGQMALGDPGSTGLNNPATVTTRAQALFGEPASLAMGLTGTPPSWNISGLSGDETIAYLSFWDAFTAGNFLFNVVAASSEIVTNGDVLRLGGGLTIRYTGGTA